MSAAEGAEDADELRSWLRAAALFLVASTSSAARPSLLLAAAYVTLLTVRPVRRWQAYTVGGLFLALALTGERDGFWWVERGWAVLVAGWFAALTLWWPRARLVSRGVGALAAAAATTGALVQVIPGGFATLDAQVGDRIRAGATALSQGLELVRGEALPEAMTTALQRAAEWQVDAFPALLGIGSLAVLGVAAWMHARLGSGETGVLPPWREFRFNDHLVWVLVAGLALDLPPMAEGARRVGLNLTLFMGALYVLRGAAVYRYFNRSRSVLGAVVLAFALAFAWPVVLLSALTIGVSDTWLDLRARERARTA